MSEGLGRKPSIFVSSTCYDLKQVRENLKSFIEDQLGYESVLSEYDSFPIDPVLNPVNNCIRAVQERADLFVLIIGNRYGCEDENGRSITNLEYLQAKQKGIPIFVFVLKDVLGVLSVWKANTHGDFSSVASSAKVFEFVETIRNDNAEWTYGFETAQDIICVLKNQLAYLFNDSLRLKTMVGKAELSKRLQQLDGESLRVLMEKPQLWEYRLFGNVLKEGLEGAIAYRDDARYNLYIGKCRVVEDISCIAEWLSRKYSELLRLASCYAKLFNVALVDALGESGQPGNPDKIVYVADSAVRVYKGIIDWSLEFDSIIIDEKYQGDLNIIRNISEPLLLDIESYVDRYNDTIFETLQRLPFEGDEPLVVDLSWSFSAFDTEEVGNAMRRMLIS